jgi:hypothetical protein
MATINKPLNGRYNQQERGLSVDLNTIRPKLTKEQRKTMTTDEKKAYNAERLREYRNAYASLYNDRVLYQHKYEEKKEKIEALAFYKKYKDTIITA